MTLQVLQKLAGEAEWFRLIVGLTRAQIKNAAQSFEELGDRGLNQPSIVREVLTLLFLLNINITALCVFTVSTGFNSFVFVFYVAALQILNQSHILCCCCSLSNVVVLPVAQSFS